MGTTERCLTHADARVERLRGLEVVAKPPPLIPWSVAFLLTFLLPQARSVAFLLTFLLPQARRIAFLLVSLALRKSLPASSSFLFLFRPLARSLAVLSTTAPPPPLLCLQSLSCSKKLRYANLSLPILRFFLRRLHGEPRKVEVWGSSGDGGGG
ncbi:hypothetical protein EJ110_NYTH54878 [Nymphaea thermarum]|nr:hypothetical protein EJ110_NYTH54878 [Nymphaea thermarum]